MVSHLIEYVVQIFDLELFFIINPFLISCTKRLNDNDNYVYSYQFVWKPYNSTYSCLFVWNVYIRGVIKKFVDWCDKTKAV